MQIHYQVCLVEISAQTNPRSNCTWVVSPVLWFCQYDLFWGSSFSCSINVFLCMTTFICVFNRIGFDFHLSLAPLLKIWLKLLYYNGYYVFTAWAAGPAQVVLLLVLWPVWVPSDTITRGDLGSWPGAPLLHFRDKTSLREYWTLKWINSEIL